MEPSIQDISSQEHKKNKKDKKKNKKDDINIDECIKEVNTKIMQLDYKKGLSVGMKEYKKILSEISNIENKLTKIEDDFLSLNANNDANYQDKINDTEDKITDENISEVSARIKDMLQNIKLSSNLTEKIKIFTECQLLINKCNHYYENLKLNIEKYD